MATKVTMDTDVIRAYWDGEPRGVTVERLFDLRNNGAIELAVTSRIIEDIPSLPLSLRIQELPALGISKTGSVIRFEQEEQGQMVGGWRLGEDRFADEKLLALFDKIENMPNSPDIGWKDQDHLHAHFLLRRDVFLTWDKRIHHIKWQLKEEFGIVVQTPEEFLDEITLS